ncbi:MULTISPECIES: VOC family protein [unclassified Pseudomonas]|jgi:predicted 3-demethylubiquinone-9 3-methyltransferase (glyoxalase superfamily)|uniref:VOC family protein n=1 Tax=unclassified Pseudomonas TaxID=196821 RepID=UPI000BA4319F|nr:MULTISPECIES: VOC family protein [unclassified Pseudomonas]MDN4543790.1 VOC family protein [Pseudomonas sp. C32]
MQRVQKLTPCLWFDDQAEDAAKFYCSIFDHSKITGMTHYGKAGFEFHGRPEGSVMTVSFELDGQSFTGLNGGPLFKFSEAISFQVNCQTQDEVDHYWGNLSAGGVPEAQQCGWLKDKFGLSWQIVPVAMMDMMKDPDTKKSQRAMAAMMQMKKLDIAALQRAFDGES